MRALARLLGLSFLTLIIVAILMLTVYFWGLGRDFPKFESDFFNYPTPWIVLEWEDHRGKDQNIILWADVEVDENNTLVAKTTAGEVPLIDALKQYPNNRWILNVMSNVQGVHDLMANVLSDKHWDGKVLIQSEYDVIMSSIKQLKPFFLYGTSSAYRMRFLVFKSLGLLPATPFKGDVYISPLTLHTTKSALVDASIVEEIHRRNKKVIAGPLTNDNEREQALNFKPDGLF